MSTALAILSLGFSLLPGCGLFYHDRFQGGGAKPDLKGTTIVGAIGSHGLLTYGTSAGAEAVDAVDVSIPIWLTQYAPKEGQSLVTSITATLYGTTPIQSHEYRLRAVGGIAAGGVLEGLEQTDDTVTIVGGAGAGSNQSATPLVLEVVVSRSYFRRVGPHDRLAVRVDVADAAIEDKAAQLSGAIRSIQESQTALAAYSSSIESSRQYLELLIAQEGTGVRIPFLRPNARTPEEQAQIARVTRLITDSQAAVKSETDKAAESSVALVKKLRDGAGRRRSKTVERTLSLISARQYSEQKLARLIPVHDIAVFPLSAQQVEYIFGDKINRNYIVLAISFQNRSDDEDRLVSSTTIEMSGLAMVRPEGDESHWFSIPVRVTPQSREHVYTVLDDEEGNETRSIVFRSIEFGGAIAAAIVTGFDAGEAAAKVVALVTGVGVPEGKKFWPDRWPGYKRNLVNYAMPNLVKVGKGTTAGPYFLFFSKTELRGVTLDPALFGVREYTNLVRIEDEPLSAPVSITHLSFDALDVPYELVDAGSPRSADEPRISQARVAELEQQIARLSLAADSTPPAPPTSDDIETAREGARKALEELQAAINASDGADQDKAPALAPVTGATSAVASATEAFSHELASVPTALAETDLSAPRTAAINAVGAFRQLLAARTSAGSAAVEKAAAATTRARLVEERDRLLPKVRAEPADPG